MRHIIKSMKEKFMLPVLPGSGLPIYPPGAPTLMDEFPEKEQKPNWFKRFIRWMAKLLYIVGK
jgi:hypothetical protein